MKNALLSTLAAFALTLGLVSSGARAGDDKKQVPPPKTEKVATAGNKLTDDSLGTMLEDLGYKPATEKTSTGSIHRVKITQNNTTYTLEIYVTTNKDRVGVDCPLFTLPKDNKVASEHLLKLLTLNDDISPCHFLVNAKTNRLWLCRMFDNREVTAAVLRGNIDSAMNSITRTKDAWSVKNWAEPVAAQK